MKQQFLRAIRPGGGATSYLAATATQIPASQTKIEQPGKNKSDYTDIDQQKGTVTVLFTKWVDYVEEPMKYQAFMCSTFSPFSMDGWMEVHFGLVGVWWWVGWCNL